MKNKTKIILIASIVLNITLIGFHLGHVFGAFNPKPKLPLEREEKKIVTILPQDKQESARQLFAKMREIRDNNFEQMDEQMKLVEEQAIAANFDEKQFLSEFSKSDEMMLKMRKESNQEIAKFLAGLTQEEREKVVNEIKNNRHFFGKKPHKFEDKPSQVEETKKLTIKK